MAPRVFFRRSISTPSDFGSICPYFTRLVSYAHIASSTRFLTASLVIRLARWNFTVLTLMWRSSPICEGIGCINVRTYIASGNVVFATAESASDVKASLEESLATYAGKPVGVVVLTPEEIATVLAENPFADHAPNHTMAIFLDGPPPPSALHRVTGRQNEDLALGQRVIYVHYGDGMGGSKLKIPAAAKGTARNMNTVAALVRLSG